jgi:hypothetical protein
MTILVSTIKAFSTPLKVSALQIQNTLALAPVYTLLLFFGGFILGFSPMLIADKGLISELLSIFLAYAIGMLLVYFLIAYVFIYALQRVLLKRQCLNLYFILGSAMLLTLCFTSMITLVPLLNLGITDFQWMASLGIMAIIGIPALLFALMYWFLLFRQHRKNESSHIQNI